MLTPGPMQLSIFQSLHGGECQTTKIPWLYIKLICKVSQSDINVNAKLSIRTMKRQ